MRPLLTSASYFKLSPLLDRWFASFGMTGDISLLHLMQQVFTGAAALFGKAIVEPFVGALATARKRGGNVTIRFEKYSSIHKRSAIVSSILYVGGMATLGVLAREFVPEESVRRFAYLYFAFFGLYTAGFLGQLAAAWFYADGDTRVPARVGAIGFSIGIAVRVALFQPMGALSVALGTSVTQIINWLMLHRLIVRRQAGQ